jgi:hypothetical protein
VIKLFVKIVNESFFKHFIVYDLVSLFWLCKRYAQDTRNQCSILGRLICCTGLR